jgi:hypothetical protein
MHPVMILLHGAAWRAMAGLTGCAVAVGAAGAALVHGFAGGLCLARLSRFSRPRPPSRSRSRPVPSWTSPRPGAVGKPRSARWAGNAARRRSRAHPRDDAARDDAVRRSHEPGARRQRAVRFRRRRRSPARQRRTRSVGVVGGRADPHRAADLRSGGASHPDLPGRPARSRTPVIGCLVVAGQCHQHRRDSVVDVSRPIAARFLPDPAQPATERVSGDHLQQHGPPIGLHGQLTAERVIVPRVAPTLLQTPIPKPAGGPCPWDVWGSCSRQQFRVIPRSGITQTRLSWKRRSG